MKRYSAILMDIDGTFLDSNGGVSRNTKNLLNRLRKKGALIALATSKSPGEVEFAARQADVTASAICYGGSLILDENRSIIADTGIEPNVALAFKAFVNGHFPDISFNSYLYDIWLSDRPEEDELWRLAEMSRKEPLRGDLASALRTTSRVHKFLCAGPPQSVQKLRESAEMMFPTLRFALSGAIYLEAFRKGVSKCAAMKIIRRHYHIDLAQMVVIGVSYADIETLREAGLGIAMGNAPEIVQNAANRVTASNDDEGVYIALKGLRFQPPGNPDAASSADA